MGVGGKAASKDASEQMKDHVGEWKSWWAGGEVGGQMREWVEGEGVVQQVCMCLGRWEWKGM